MDLGWNLNLLLELLFDQNDDQSRKMRFYEETNAFHAFSEGGRKKRFFEGYFCQSCSHASKMTIFEVSRGPNSDFSREGWSNMRFLGVPKHRCKKGR